MINEIKFIKNGELNELLKYDKLQLNKLTLLVGANGSGKSSILYGLATNKPKMECQYGAYYRTCGEGLEIIGDTPKENIICFSARHDNGKYRGYFDDDITTDLQSMFMSEGQSVLNTFVSFINNKLLPILKNEEQVTFLIDELDSGVTPDNILKMVKIIIGVSCKFNNLQIIMTTNNFDFMFILGDNNNIIKVKSGEKIKVESYKDFMGIYY